MGSLLLMNSLDVARSLGNDPLNARPEDVASFLNREFRGGGGTFNYNPSIKSLPGLFDGSLNADAAVEYCLNNGAPAGRQQNANAMALVSGYAEDNKSTCYRIPFTAVAIGRLRGNRTAYMSIKAPLVRVCNRDVLVVVPGFRMGHRPKGIEIDVAASLALANFARDDFVEADYEYLDCSRGGSGERELQTYRGRDREIFDLDAVDHLLDVYVKGLTLAIDGGMEAKKPNLGGYHVQDPDQPRMI